MPEDEPNLLYQKYLRPCRHDKKRIRYMRELPAVPVQDKLRYLLYKGQTYNENLSLEIIELLLEYGQTFPAAELLPTWQAIEPYWECFNTALAVNKFRDDLKYAEGVGLPFGQIQGSMVHAWNIDSETDLLHDFTWPMAPWNQYLGIVFDLEWTKQNCVMPHGIFHPINWDRNRDPVTDYLKNRAPRGQ